MSVRKFGGLFSFFLPSAHRVSNALAAILTLFSFVQLLPFVFTVETWDNHLSGFLNVIVVFRFQYLLAKATYFTYIGVFIFIAVLAVLALLLGGGVAWMYRDEPFPHANVSGALKFVTGLLGKMLFISCLGLSLSFLDCSRGGSTKYMLMYPDTVCWQSSHIALAVAGLVSAIVIILLSVLAMFMNVALCPGPNSLATPRIGPSALELFFHLVLVVTAIGIPNDSVAWPVVQVVSFAVLFRKVAYEAPYFKPWVNLVHSGCYCLLLQASLVALAGRIALTSGKVDALLTRKVVSIVVGPAGGVCRS